MTEGRNDDGAAPAISVMTNPGEGSSSSPEDAKPRGMSRHLGRAGIWVLAGLVVVLVIVAGVPFWAPSVSHYLPWGAGKNGAGKLAQLQAKLSQAERDRDQAVARLARTPPPPAAAAAVPAPALAALAQRVTTLEHEAATPPDMTAALAPVMTKLNRLTAQLDAVAAQLDKVAAQIDKVTADKTRVGDDADRMLLVTIAELSGAIATSRPYAGEMAAVTALAQGRPDLVPLLAPLAAGAGHGLPSTALLAERFTTTTAPAILRAVAAAPRGQSWGAWILARLRSLVVIRRAGAPEAGVPADPTAAAVARAQAALDRGDLAGAVAALKTLHGAGAQAAAPWLAQAAPRLAAETALGTLTARVAEHLTQASGAPGAGGAAPSTVGDETR